MFKSIVVNVSDDQILNHSLPDVLTHEGNKIVFEENNQVMQTGQAKQLFNRIRFGNDTSILFLTAKTPTYDEHGNINGVFGISQILSEYDIRNSNIDCLTKKERDCLMMLAKGKQLNKLLKH